MNRQDHWDKMWSKGQPDELSWFQSEPALSLELIEASKIDHRAQVTDVGGGASVLIDRLLERGFTNLAVLDISQAAIGHAKARLGAKSDNVRWYTGDVIDFVTEQPVDLWHDRAVLHFLTRKQDQESYVKALMQALALGGHVVISTFALNGPERCSGRPCVRYGPENITTLFGPSFQLVQTLPETHTTPGNAKQRFMYFLLRRVY